MTLEERAEKVVARICETMNNKPLHRDYNPSFIANIAEVLFGANDEDVKVLRGITGPVAESVAYLEKSTGDFLVLLPDSRRYEGGINAYAFYTGAIFDKPGDWTTARCVYVHTYYLEKCCDKIDWNDIPLSAQAALLNILARKDEPGTWDKKY